MVAAARLARIHAVEGLAAHVAHGAWSRTVDDQLVGVVDADPLCGMQRDREAGRVEHRPVDADPMAARIEDDIVPDVLGGPGSSGWSNVRTTVVGMAWYP